MVKRKKNVYLSSEQKKTTSDFLAQNCCCIFYLFFAIMCQNCEKSIIELFLVRKMKAVFRRCRPEDEQLLDCTVSSAQDVS